MKRNWIEVDLDGLKSILQRRGMEFIVYELLQNAYDEDVTRVDLDFTWDNGVATLSCVDDSPEGFRDLSDAYTLYKKSYKTQHSTKRGRFNAGEKFILALCTEAQIVSTKGTVKFNADGTRSKNRNTTQFGTRFLAKLPLLKRDYDQICAAVSQIIPPVRTIFNGQEIAGRMFLADFEETLPTVLLNDEGILRPTQRKTTVRVYEPFPGETPMLYEMGIPVVPTGDKWHVDVQQKVPLNAERDNVTPSYLRAIRVSVVNAMVDHITPEEAANTWVKEATSDERCSNEAIMIVMDKRFGTDRVSYDLRDIGSNREAASQNFTVVHGGALSAREWENARRAGAIEPAGVKFSTILSGKVPDKVYHPSEYTADMAWYAGFVARVSPMLIARNISLKFIKDQGIVAGCFNHVEGVVTINLAHIDIAGRPSEQFLDILIHELAHDTVRSNDHLNAKFYSACCGIGAKLARILLYQRDSVLVY